MKRLHHLRIGGMVFFSMCLAITVTMVLLAATTISVAEPLPAPTPTPAVKPTLASSLTPSLAPISAPESAPIPTLTQDQGLTTAPDLTRPSPTDKDLSNIYIGCLHSAHTNYSDGRLLYPGEFYSLFRSYWDWVATTDHDSYLDTSKLQNMVENANAYNRKNFVSLFGYEWTSDRWGHLSVVFKGVNPSKTPAVAKSWSTNSNTPQKLYTFLNTHDGLAVFAHPALPGLHIDFNQESDYRNDAVASLAEIIAFDNTIHWNVTWDYVDGRTIPVPGAESAYDGGWIKKALNRGYRLGFVSALDLHKKEINPMSYRYTGVVADSLTRAGIFEALKGRHTYAVMSPSGLGKRILIRADTGNYLMGDIFEYNCNMIDVTLRGKTDLSKFTLINVFVNGKIVESRIVSGCDLVEDFMIRLVDGDNYTFFEVRALSDDGQISQAFTSPMYVTVRQARDPNGDY